MIRTIVCGVDESRGGRSAVAVAADIAGRTDARLVLVHAVPQAIAPFAPIATPMGPGAVVDLRARAREGAAEHLAEMSRNAGVDAETAVIDGAPGWALPEYAHAEGAELMVIGARRHGALDAAVFGSVSSAILRRAPCPVVVVPCAVTARDGGLHGTSVLCGIDRPEHDDVVATTGAALAEDLGLRLVLATVLRTGPHEELSVRDAAPRGRIVRPGRSMGREHLPAALAERLVASSPAVMHVSLRFTYGDPADGLFRLAVDEQAAIVVVGSRRRGPLRAALFGSVSTWLTMHAHVPVVVTEPFGAVGVAPATQTARLGS